MLFEHVAKTKNFSFALENVIIFFSHHVGLWGKWRTLLGIFFLSMNIFRIAKMLRFLSLISFSHIKSYPSVSIGSYYTFSLKRDCPNYVDKHQTKRFLYCFFFFFRICTDYFPFFFFLFVHMILKEYHYIHIVIPLHYCIVIIIIFFFAKIL